jgi:hypothetical protein
VPVLLFDDVAVAAVLAVVLAELPVIILLALAWRATLAAGLLLNMCMWMRKALRVRKNPAHAKRESHAAVAMLELNDDRTHSDREDYTLCEVRDAGLLEL